MSKRGRDLYALLGVAPDADVREVARGYRRRLREVHPDTRDRLADAPDPAHADLKVLQEAYAVLRDPARRARYDVQRRAAQKPAEAPATGGGGAGPGAGPPATAGTGLADPGGTRAFRAATEPVKLVDRELAVQ